MHLPVENLKYLRKTSRNLLNMPAGGISLFADYDYENSSQWTYMEMETGERLNERDCSRCAYPLVCVLGVACGG